jgi:hypothetical protein
MIQAKPLHEYRGVEMAGFNALIGTRKNSAAGEHRPIEKADD